MGVATLTNHPRSIDMEVYVTGKTYSKLDEEIRDHVQECEVCLRKAAELVRKRRSAEGASASEHSGRTH
ncbi:MAG: hypothetical protein ABJF23_13870 [Bryobacteraceae bacterium]